MKDISDEAKAVVHSYLSKALLVFVVVGGAVIIGIGAWAYKHVQNRVAAATVAATADIDEQVDQHLTKALATHTSDLDDIQKRAWALRDQLGGLRSQVEQLTGAASTVNPEVLKQDLAAFASFKDALADAGGDQWLGEVNDKLGRFESDIKKLQGDVLNAAKGQNRNRRPAMDMKGKQVPSGNFELASGGSQVDLSKAKSDIQVAFFYASWCPYCKKALPQLNQLANEYDAKPVEFYGISMDTIVDAPDPSNKRAKTRDQVTGQWQEFGIKFPQAMDSSKTGSQEFKVTTFPTIFLMSNGKIEEVYVGATAVTDGTLKKQIEGLLKATS